MQTRTVTLRAQLQDCALTLYQERGYDGTTVAAIAARAGVTERTFFRHFADKREVLFGHEEVMGEALSDAVARAPESLAAVELARAGVVALAARLQPRYAELVLRESVVASHPDLRERERSKLAGWQHVLATAMCGRGIEQLDAELTGGLAVTVLDVCARHWLASGIESDLSASVDEGFARVSIAMQALDPA